MEHGVVLSVRKYFTYMVRCADGTLYTGYTVDDVNERIAMHNSGKGAKYTRSRRPVMLVFAKEWDTLHEAMSMEYTIKHMNRREKEQLIGEAARSGAANE
ncbi:MAG: GIY-YIG nuclease family protein [Dialister sp.]|nr:GIY-YIG nuclease family protein [Dialister sp.]